MLARIDYEHIKYGNTLGVVQNSRIVLNNQEVTSNLLVDKHSVKYGLHTKIVPQERYGTRVLTSDACGMRGHLRCSRCRAFFEQSIPVWNRLYEGTN
jgi:hypothetical protein